MYSERRVHFSGATRRRPPHLDHAQVIGNIAAIGYVNRHGVIPKGGSRMDQKIIDLFDKYTHGQMDRRDFLERLTKLAGSTAAAMAVLPLLQSDWAQAAIVDEKDARLATERVTFELAEGQDQRLPGAAEVTRQAPHHPGDPREPRPQSASRRRRPPLRGRRLPRLCDRPALAGGRHAGRRAGSAQAASEDERRTTPSPHWSPRCRS